MNRRLILNAIGKIMLVEAALMALPVAVAIIYGEYNLLLSFAVPVVALIVIGLPFTKVRMRTKTMYARDGYIICALGWIVMSFFGALPFFFSREIPNFVDAFFEAVSGFTTTGATILTDVEVLSKSIIFWRSFTHWIGGMGVLVFIMAVMPLAGGSGNLQLMRAESTGPDVGKLVPKSKDSARILYGIYFGLTFIEFLLLLCGEMDVFESAAMAFGTAGTGGFGLLNDSCGSYSTYTQIVITVFMTLFGVNFSIYFLILCGNIREAFKSEELRTYLGIILIAVTIISINTHSMYSSAGQTVLASAFQVSSVMTTTGFSTVDFNLWPEISRMLMLLIMCIGGCAGSTGGGFKVARVMLLVKNARKEIRTLMHPRSVNVVTFEGKRVSDKVIKTTSVYLVIYMLIFAVSVFIISFDKMDTVSNITSVISALNNIGPGLNVVGPAGNFADFSAISKLVFVCDMLLGRLEIFPVLLLFTPTLIKKYRRPVSKQAEEEEEQEMA